MAKNIGKDCQKTNLKEHPSILISENLHSNIEEFSFRPVSDSEVMKILSKIDPKKSTGVDNISAKIIKSCTSSIQRTVANLINITFRKCQFPASLKGGAGSASSQKE